MKKPGIADIAECLNVSKTLVSMVLNGNGDKYGIGAETQKKVIEKATELNYKPNRVARGLRLGKSNVLGLVVADISNPFYSYIARYIEGYASDAGYNLMICNTHEDVEKEQAIIQMLREQQVDGVIVATSNSIPTDFIKLQEEKYPFVLIDRCFKDLKMNAVITDNYTGAFEAVEHLIQLGYQRIAHITLTPDYLSTLTERKMGYIDALKKHKFKPSSKRILTVPFAKIKTELRSELISLLKGPHAADALFIGNNNLTVSCLEILNDLKIRVPQHIAILSYDDIELFIVNSPSITAVAQPIEEMCKQSLKILLQNIHNNSAESYKTHLDVLKSKLIIRQSCGNAFVNS
ncbi:MAG: LacI family DNA-binding transcriptional regulator [Bacteroidota bacterium]